MTDVKTARRRHRPLRRGLPLLLVPDALERITAGRDDLRNSKGTPVLSRIADAAGIDKQRLSEAGAGQTPNTFTLGALVKCYAEIHGVSHAEAMAALVRLPDEAEADALFMAAA